MKLGHDFVYGWFPVFAAAGAARRLTRCGELLREIQPVITQPGGGAGAVTASGLSSVGRMQAAREAI
jgi:hypothetical protein